MFVNNPKQHILLEGYFLPQEYKSPQGFPRVKNIGRNREKHGKDILQQLEQIHIQFTTEQKNLDLPIGIKHDAIIYVRFVSEWGFPLKIESLNNNTDQPLYRICNVQTEQRPRGKSMEYRYHVIVALREGGIGVFISKINEYLTENIVTKGMVSENPKHYALFNNIQLIQKAALEAFWVEAPEVPFPASNQEVWWEVWFRRDIDDESKISDVLENLQLFDVQIGATELVFPEHRVRLVKATPEQLAGSLLLLDNLSELRKPQETADFFTKCTRNEQLEWVTNLQSRTSVKWDENSSLICIIDTGVNNKHPLLEAFLPDDHLDSYNPNSWGFYDSHPNGGHGTGVAGLALYGDLVDVLSGQSPIHIFHGLESYKLIQKDEEHSEDQFGYVTVEAVNAPLVSRPFNPRVFCMAITGKHPYKGRPSAWSAKIDEIAFGKVIPDNQPQLFIISSGNVPIETPSDYPAKNALESVQDPAQAFNAITVGAYTRKDRIAEVTGYSPLAPFGKMAPANSTSLLWERQWPIKPDIVMEGGNLSFKDDGVLDHGELALLSLDNEFSKYPFRTFSDTSASVALAAKFAAELRTAYPDYWPETIRGLMIHSAEWTDPMLSDINTKLKKDFNSLLRTVGYGVPILEKALKSGSNSLTIIAERTIQPFKTAKSEIDYNQYHFYELPWPTNVLRDELFDQNVTLKITLSYYIEPNPGSKNHNYANSFQYQSHGLDFAVIKPNEKDEAFKRRISAASEKSDEPQDSKGEPWTLNKLRKRGSIKKDFLTMSGADLATRNKIAVFPTSGWYRMLKKQGKGNATVRYSLIVSLETPNLEVDIYTPVANQIAVKVEVVN